MMQLIAMGVTAVSPWAIIFSRAAWEANVATCFIVWGIVCGLLVSNITAFRKKTIIIVLSFFLFALSMYTYHSARVIAPLLALMFLINWFLQRTGRPTDWKNLVQWGKKNFSQITYFFIIGCFFLICISPILFSLRDKTTQQRLAETNIFADGHIAVETNHYQDLAQHAWWARLVYHRYFFYLKEYLSNYFLHFRFDFLFVNGDVNLRHSVQYFGEMYLIESVFLVLGIFFFLKNWRKETLLIFFWLLIGIAPAALTKDTPHALRILPSMPAFLLLISFGIGWLCVRILLFFHSWFNSYFEKIVLKRKIPMMRNFSASGIVITAFVVIYAVQFGAFWHFYSVVYPKLYSGAWQYGYRQIVEEVNRRKSQEKKIFFLREMDRPAMAYWFFSQTDPHEVQQIDRVLQKDQGPFLPFENITFINFINEAEPGLVASSVTSMEDAVQKGHKVSDKTEIKDPNGKAIWVVYKLD
jgi:hypothetical protein